MVILSSSPNAPYQTRHGVMYRAPAIIYHARTTVRFPVNMRRFNTNQRAIESEIVTTERAP